MRIPRIFHQYWGGSEFPDVYVAYRDSWMQHHPDWEFMQWSADNLPYLQAQEQYDNSEHSEHSERYKSNVLRFELLFQFGGVWIDCDMECLKPIDKLISRYGAFLGEAEDGVPHTAIMGCEAFHPFAVDLCEFVRNLTPNPTIREMSMWAVERTLRTHPEVKRFPSKYFYAQNRSTGEGDTSDSYGVHHPRAYEGDPVHLAAQAADSQPEGKGKV